MTKILIVEDEKNIILSLQMYLKKLGFEVLIVENGIDAVNVCEAEKPGLILLDILIPKMNGFLVCETIKNNLETSQIPIIFMSAKNQQEDIDKAFSVGGDDFLIKPFDPEQLMKMINNYLK